MMTLYKKIRQKLLSQNRVTKYLLYAFGEIILVVIGILIAISLNSKTNQKENDQKIQQILRQIQNELLTDITDAKRIMNKSIDSDSLIYLIIHDSLSVDKVLKNPHLINFRDTYASFTIKKTGYKRLMDNIEIIPKKYQSILPILNDLYEEQQNDIDDYNAEFKKFVFYNVQQQLTTNPSNYKIYLVYTKEIVTDILNDPYFKNNSLLFDLHLKNLSAAASLHRISSIKLYKKIDSMLGNKTKNTTEVLATLPPKDEIKKWVGTYQNIKNKELKFDVKSNSNSLTITIDKNTIPLYWHGDNFFYVENGIAFFKFKTTANQKKILYISSGSIIQEMEKIK